MRTIRNLLVAATLGTFAVAACSGGPARDREVASEQTARQPVKSSPALPAGSYEVQSVSYDDATGQYRVFILGAPDGTKPLYESHDIRMARLEDAEIEAGKKSSIVFGDGAPTLRLTPDFQIAYVHNVTEQQVDPSTGREETVIVRQETSSWSPFLSAMAGAAVGNMLFAPRYYYPPPYAAGPMVGYGSATSHPLPPPRVARLSRTGMSPKAVPPSSLRPSGSGAGANKWRSFSKPQSPSRGRSFGFGGGRRR